MLCKSRHPSSLNHQPSKHGISVHRPHHDVTVQRRVINQNRMSPIALASLSRLLQFSHVLGKRLLVCLDAESAQRFGTPDWLANATHHAGILAVFQDANVPETKLYKALVHEIHGRPDVERNRRLQRPSATSPSPQKAHWSTHGIDVLCEVGRVGLLVVFVNAWHSIHQAAARLLVFQPIQGVLKVWGGNETD